MTPKSPSSSELARIGKTFLELGGIHLRPKSRFFIARRKTIELPGFIRAVFEHVWVECDFQSGLKCSCRHQVIASFEHGHRLRGDRALLLLETRILMVEMATRISERSAVRKETLSASKACHAS